MGDGNNDGADMTVVALRDCDHNCAGPILHPFDSALIVFRAPEKAVTNDEAGPGYRDTHLGSAPYSAAPAETFTRGRDFAAWLVSVVRVFETNGGLI